MIEYVKKHLVIPVFILSFILFSGSCASLGPMTVKRERINYNAALQHTNDEQILMNLVLQSKLVLY